MILTLRISLPTPRAATASASTMFSIASRRLFKYAVSRVPAGRKALSQAVAQSAKSAKRYRTGGEQKVTVQHVSVSDGGQAIVGNVTQASRAAEQVAKTAPQLTHAKQAPMTVLGAEANEPTAVAVLRTAEKSDGKSSA